MDFQVLGDVAAWHDGRPVDLGRRQERCLLGLLLLEAGRVVSANRLVELLWRDSPPNTGRRTVHTYVARLRHRLAPFQVRIVTRGPGYLVDIDPSRVDVHRFFAMTAAAKQLTDPARRATALADSLRLWRGPFLAGVADDELGQQLGAGIEETRRDAVESWLEAMLAAGQHHDAVGRLTDLVKRYPTRERLAGLLMLALYRCHRTADALAVYRGIREKLVAELGLEPSGDLQHLHMQILAKAPELAVPQPNPPIAEVSGRRFLPRDVPDFTGRLADLAQLDALAESGPAGTTAVVISAIAGLAGIGKTALAIRWAHSVASRFPDGQLYINLRGYDQAAPMRSIDALGRLLRCVGVPAEGVPEDADEASALYRSRLADQRMLILLDNAASAEQVRPLLPGSSSNLVVVTSRDDLAGLIARDGARRITLDLMPAQDAVALLRRVLGDDRVDAEPREAEKLAETCGHLPLTLRIAAANLLGRPEATIADTVADLTYGDRLTALAIQADPNTAVRVVFDQSYRALPDGCQRLFCLLGLVPGEDVTAQAAAELADRPVEEVTRLLDSLVRASLVHRSDSGERFSLHDLLRLYAREQAARQLSVSDHQSALSNLFSGYSLRARAAADVLYPEAMRLPGPAPRQRPSDTEALAFLRDEESNLVATIDHAATHGPFAVAWQLADALRAYLSSRASTATWLTVASHGLAAARREGDAFGQVASLLSLAHLHVNNGRYLEALDEYHQALVLSRKAGWREAEGAVLGNLGTVSARLCRLAEAADYQQQALAIATEFGEQPRRALILGNLGGIRHRQGKLQDAAEAMAQALSLHRRLGALGGQALQLNNIGIVLRELGRLDEAQLALDEALSTYQDMNNAAGVGMVLCSLADLHRDRGALDDALRYAHSAFAMPELNDNDEHIAYALNCAGTIHLRLSNPDISVEKHRQAIALVRQVGNRELLAESLIGLAAALNQSGQPHDATEPAHEALAIGRQTGHGLLEALALTALSECLLAAGELDEASALIEQAVAAHKEVGHHAGTQAAASLGDRIASGRSKSPDRPLTTPS